jgi:excisionase family DNA binding protein
MSGLLTIKEAAGVLRVSESTMRRLKRNGQVPFVRISTNGRTGVIRFRPEDLQDVVHAHVQNANSITTLHDEAFARS